MTAAVTHTISTAVIIFELTGSLNLMLPVMLGVLLANAIAQKLSLSLYDSMIVLNGIPYIPNLSPGPTYGVTASRIMRTAVYSFKLHFETELEMHAFLRHEPLRRINYY